MLLSQDKARSTFVNRSTFHYHTWILKNQEVILIKFIICVQAKSQEPRVTTFFSEVTFRCLPSGHSIFYCKKIRWIDSITKSIREPQYLFTSYKTRNPRRRQEIVPKLSSSDCKFWCRHVPNQESQEQARNRIETSSVFELLSPERSSNQGSQQEMANTRIKIRSNCKYWCRHVAREDEEIVQPTLVEL